MTLVIANAALLAQLDAFGARANGGKLRIYDGTRPANPQTAVTTQVKLVEFTLNDPAFNASTMFAANQAQMLANVSGIADQLGLANSNATWGRVINSAGAVLWDGDVGTSSTADFQLNVLAITTTSLISLISIDLRQGSGA